MLIWLNCWLDPRNRTSVFVAHTQCDIIHIILCEYLDASSNSFYYVLLARVVTNTRRRDHITPVLAGLRWLPVRYRIEYKIALITFKALTTQQPQYLLELIRH